MRVALHDGAAGGGGGGGGGCQIPAFIYWDVDDDTVLGTDENPWALSAFIVSMLLFFG